MLLWTVNQSSIVVNYCKYCTLFVYQHFLGFWAGQSYKLCSHHISLTSDFTNQTLCIDLLVYSSFMENASTMNSVTAHRILIMGAGAIGGLLGVKLSMRGHAVTFVGRGAHLRAMQKAGHMLMRTMDGREEQSDDSCVFTDDLDSLPGGAFDVVILAVKMHQIEPVSQKLPRLLSENGVYLATQNGLPWWYFQRNDKAPEKLRNSRVDAVDPAGVLFSTIDPSRLLAAIVYPAAEIVEPGVILHVTGVRFPLGELDGTDSPRAKMLSSILEDAGFKAPVLPDVRAELWLKLWGTVVVNPMSALTHATLGELCDPDSPSRPIVEAVMREVESVANAAGERLRLPLERRVEGARKVGDHKTSMLQDVEDGKPVEVDAIMGAVIEIAKKIGCVTPHLDTMYGTMKMLEWVLSKRNAKVPLLPSL